MSFVNDKKVRSGERGSRGTIWHWLCLPRSSDIEEPSAAVTASTDLGATTLSVILLGVRVSAQPFVMYISIYLKVISRKYIFKQDSRISRLNMSSRAIESIFSSVRPQQAVPVREISEAGLSRHASDIKKIYEDLSIYIDKGKWWGSYQINDLVVFNDFKTSDYQLYQRLKLLDCFPYVIESRGVYDIY